MMPCPSKTVRPAPELLALVKALARQAANEDHVKQLDATQRRENTCDTNLFQQIHAEGFY